MPDLNIPLCRSCNAPLPAAPGPGRRRRYCSDRCRQAASRMRHGAFGTVYVPTADEDRAEAFLVGKAREASTDEQAVAAIHEAMLLVASFERLSREARICGG